MGIRLLRKKGSFRRSTLAARIAMAVEAAVVDFRREMGAARYVIALEAKPQRKICSLATKAMYLGKAQASSSGSQSVVWLATTNS